MTPVIRTEMSVHVDTTDTNYEINYFSNYSTVCFGFPDNHTRIPCLIAYIVYACTHPWCVLRQLGKGMQIVVRVTHSYHTCVTRLGKPSGSTTEPLIHGTIPGDANQLKQSF